MNQARYSIKGKRNDSRIVIKQEGHKVWKIRTDNKKELIKELRDLKFKL